MTGPDDLAALHRRLDRERAARRQAESIAEEVTAKLYASSVELQQSNEALTKANMQLQEVNQSMRDFVAVASHDLRGPLTSVLGYAGVLLGSWPRLTEAQKLDAIAIIRRQGEHLHRLVNDLLTVSKIEAGALDVHCEVVKLHEATKLAIESFTDKASRIELLVPEGLAAACDPEHLRRILSNYVANAIKYGEPPVTIEAHDAGDAVEIRVRDEGGGVPPDFVPRLFGRFARAEQSGDGTGLGLSIVRGLAVANGGTTWYEPNQPTGSCFAVRLPKAS